MGSLESCMGMRLLMMTMMMTVMMMKKMMMVMMTMMKIMIIIREGFKNPSNGNFPLRGGGGTPLFR